MAPCLLEKVLKSGALGVYRVYKGCHLGAHTREPSLDPKP